MSRDRRPIVVAPTLGDILTSTAFTRNAVEWKGERPGTGMAASRPGANDRK
jgi:hypothetical protein